MTTARETVDLKRVGELMPIKAGCLRIRGADLNLLGSDWREEIFGMAKGECTREQMGAEQDVKQSANGRAEQDVPCVLARWSSGGWRTGGEPVCAAPAGVRPGGCSEKVRSHIQSSCDQTALGSLQRWTT